MDSKLSFIIFLVAAELFMAAGQRSDVMAQTGRIDLPKPRMKGEMSLEETIQSPPARAPIPRVIKPKVRSGWRGF